MSSRSRFIWYELATPDPAAALAFYQAVVGWVVDDSSPPDASYTILSASDHGVAGLTALPPEARAAGAIPAWIGYIDVADTDGTAKRMVDAGASLLRAPADIPGVGRFAVLADPGGAVFMLLTPQPREDATPAPDPSALGRVSWHELYAGSGQQAAFEFYAGELGWQTDELMDIGDMGQYRLFSSDGVQLGGMMDKPPQMAVGAWGFYVNVEGIDAAVSRIQASGGQLQMGPQQVPGGRWIVRAIDPQGAAFALVSDTR